MNKRTFTKEEVAQILPLIKDGKATCLHSEANYPLYGDIPDDYTFTFVVPFGNSWWKLDLKTKRAGWTVEKGEYIAEAVEAVEMRPQERAVKVIDWVEV